MVDARTCSNPHYLLPGIDTGSSHSAARETASSLTLSLTPRSPPPLPCHSERSKASVLPSLLVSLLVSVPPVSSVVHSSIVNRHSSRLRVVLRISAPLRSSFLPSPFSLLPSLFSPLSTPPFTSRSPPSTPPLTPTIKPCGAFVRTVRLGSGSPPRGGPA